MGNPGTNGSVVNNSSDLTYGASSTIESQIQQLWSRYAVTKHNDDFKNNLLEDVLTRYELLLQKHQRYVEEHKQEREHSQESLDREKYWYEQAMHLQRILNRDPYILVLIDGDGMIFNDSFLKQGEIGGQQAATILHSAVMEWATGEIQECPADVKVVTRVYANVKALGEACTRAGIIASPAQLADFARGFTNARTLFDFTDVGDGKETLGAKIVETMKLHLYDYHCRQLLFGCSHDKGYARLLEPYIPETEVHPRFTILEGVPLEKELQLLPFKKKSFKGVFRESRIMLPGQLDMLTALRGRVDSRMALNATSDVFTPRTGTPISSYSPLRDISNVDRRQSISARDSTVSPAASVNSGETTWATVTYKNKNKPLTDLPRSNPEVEGQVKRNKKGQRIDTELEYDRDEVQRIKKLKSCNQHYIGIGCCHYIAGKADKCPHNHHFKFSPHELKWLRVVARETPCKRGHECDDPKCIYGHQCPFPVAAEGSMRGSVSCLNGDDCRFPRSMHGMDLIPAKLTKVTGIY